MFGHPLNGSLILLSQKVSSQGPPSFALHHLTTFSESDSTVMLMLMLMLGMISNVSRSL